MIDLSDGLSTDLAHICEESGVGAEIQSDAIPRAAIGKPAHQVDLKYALHGGDDYELLFTAPSHKRVPTRIAGVAITQIGRITRGRQVMLINRENRAAKFRPQGWEYFRRAAGSIASGPKMADGKAASESKPEASGQHVTFVLPEPLLYVPPSANRSKVSLCSLELASFSPPCV